MSSYPLPTEVMESIRNYALSSPEFQDGAWYQVSFKFKVKKDKSVEVDYEVNEDTKPE